MERHVAWVGCSYPWRRSAMESALGQMTCVKGGPRGGRGALGPARRAARSLTPLPWRALSSRRVTLLSTRTSHPADQVLPTLTAPSCKGPRRNPAGPAAPGPRPASSPVTCPAGRLARATTWNFVLTWTTLHHIVCLMRERYVLSCTR